MAAVLNFSHSYFSSQLNVSPVPSIAQLEESVNREEFKKKDLVGVNATVYVPLPKYFKKQSASSLSQYDVWYYLREGNDTEKVTAHHYDDLFKYQGQIYEFLVHDVLEYQGHRELASKALSWINGKGKNNKSTLVWDMGAGHGPDIQELRGNGFKGKVVGIDVCEPAKRSHYSDMPYTTHKYDDYFLGKASKSDEIKSALNAPPDLLIVGTVTPPDGAVEDVREIVDKMPSGGCVVINLPVNKDDSCQNMYQYLENSQNLRLQESSIYQHRLHMDGQPMDMRIQTYVVL